MTTPATRIQPPLLSVVVPARNSAPWVGELLESLLAQGVESSEIIVVDNGSCDDTAEIVEQHTARDPRVRLIRSQATSAAAARNDGVDAALGAYLVFADSDDIVPDGAHEAMLAALEASGSDMVIGDHLKFSPTSTWSPTKRWSPFDEPLRAVPPEDAPSLMTGRACWNRMFRRSFWDRAGLRFPEIPSVDDIVPMTRAFVTAESLDVVPSPVYLYRDRHDGSSISQRSDAATTVRYLQQETICARLVADRPGLRAQHAEIVFDADGWAHLARFVASRPSSADTAAVRAELGRLLDVVPLGAAHGIEVGRRVLWALVLDGSWGVASAFVTGSVSADARERLDAWIAAISALRAGGSGLFDLGDIVGAGLFPALVNGADAVGHDWLAAALPTLQDLPGGDPSPGLASSMARAVRSGDARAVMSVSGLRHLVPLVVGAAVPKLDGLEISGALPASSVRPAMALRLQNGATTLVVRVESGPGSWTAFLDGSSMGAGRWTMTVGADDVDGQFPVVSARMALPPIGDAFPIQPLADRADGWRFLVDRRHPRRTGLGALVERVRRRTR